MSLELAINNALTGLNVNQRSLTVVSQNIANANTEGYTRKVVDQSAVYVGNQQLGSGVRIDDIVRKVDLYLQRSTRIQTSVYSKTETISQNLDRIQVMLGQPGDINSLDEFMETFFNSLQSLAQTPERISFREGAVDTGINLARELSSLAFSLEDLRGQLDNELAIEVGNLNNYLTSLDKVNVAITNASALGNPVSGLQDEQDKLIKQIAKLVEVQVLVQANTSEVFLYTANGTPLLDQSAYEVSYKQPFSVETFINDAPLNAVEIYRLDNSGARQSLPDILVTAGKSSEVTTKLEQGKIKGLLELRDDLIPNMLQQLDELAAKLRDSMNAIHNKGSSFPPPNVLTGTRAVSPTEAYNWEGKVMIAALDKNGKPIASPYRNETHTGVRPLLLDLSQLDTGGGVGQPNMQGIIDEINHHFNPPTVKVNLGNLQNIQLVANTDRLPSTGLNFDFDFELENIAEAGSEFFVTNVAVLDSLGAAVVSPITTTRPNFTISTFNTTNGSSQVTVRTALPHGLAAGDVVFLEQPAGVVNGIAASALAGYFTVGNVTADSFTVDAVQVATATGPVGGGTTRVLPPYDEIDAGEKSRTKSKGTITADLSAAAGSSFYDFQITVGVRATDSSVTSPQVSTSVITFRVPNNTQNMRNDRFDNIAANGAAVRDIPLTNVPQLRAIMVDENGVELARNSFGNYLENNGFLKIIGNGDNRIAIDELDSKQVGITNITPTEKGTNRGFSHYFELNNFFESNQPTKTGDTRKNSAINLKVEERLQNDSNLIAVGKLERTNQPTSANALPLYTYERRAGNNQTIQDLAKLAVNIQDFDPAGGLSNSRQTLNGYTGEVLAFFASNANNAVLNSKDNKILLDGFEQRLDAIVGVNVDEELANMILFQNAYTASARIITTANEMFDALLQAV
jgi:flagellar hook-associated protein 1 FlgK